MNLKQAKRLRKEIERQGFDLSEPRKYLVKLTKNGTRKTYYNDPSSARAKYQKAKRGT